jgi:DnaJ-class molecular chaperone
MAKVRFVNYEDAPPRVEGRPSDWWNVLGVTRTATAAEITKAYRALMIKHHPDRGGSAAECIKINAARDEALKEKQL